ncbi:MAG: hypothetical protein H6556_00095 [Lewinellaceae bacterium]|nr:hypothetical protein [Lewinellaceae bacterium]
MKLIKANPYRTVGLLVGATAREQERQIKRLKKYIHAEQAPQDDFSFPVLGFLHRTVEKVDEAASSLNLNQDRMGAALFWFYNGNGITDEPAFDSLKESNWEISKTIWSKLTSRREIIERNSSAYQNLSTLLLWEAFKDGNINSSFFEEGISLKLQFLDSDFVLGFKALTTDDTFKVTKKELQLLFLQQLQREIGQNGQMNSFQFLDIISRQDFLAKEEFLKSFVQKPIEEIEKKIEQAKAKRKNDETKAIQAGEALYVQTNNSLAQLKRALGSDHVKFASISDRVADEILQCGIDFFLHYRDTDTDPGEESMKLFRKAFLLAVGNITRQRCSENMDNLQEWINNKPEREKQQLIKEDLVFIGSKLERFQRLPDKVENAEDLINSCKPRLMNIKRTLGETDDFFLKLSTAVAGNAQGMLVKAVNDAQAIFAQVGPSNPEAGIYHLQSIIDKAYYVTSSMESMHMEPNLRAQFIKNKAAIEGIRSQISMLAKRVQVSRSKNEGCYIATMAYGDYDHPQVKVLREFRDSVLQKSATGRWMIKMYYHYSPNLVDYMKDKKAVNRMIRNVLDRIINLIKQ